MSDRYSVWYVNGDEANDYYLTLDQAKALAAECEADGYEVVITKMEQD